jgi:drug/metabolite transporter (DMT)-like permease
MSAQLATLTTIVSEITLALHPILIKQIPTNLSTQLVSRLGVYSALALALSSQQERIWTWGSSGNVLQSLALGFMNLIHIAASYLSYKLLPAGSALALFYTFPFMNILVGILFLGDTLDLKIIPLMILAFIGVLLIAKYTKDGNGKEHSKDKKDEEDSENSKDTKDKKDIKDTRDSVLLGVMVSLLAAATETMIFLVGKSSESPFVSILRLYPVAFLGILGWVFIKGEAISTESSVWIPMILFNVVIGFIGYALRFFSIPRLPTAFYSILTFIGVAAGYMWGIVYAKEIPSAGALSGAALITGSLGILRYLK